MWYTLNEIRDLGKPPYFEARIYCGKERRHTFRAMSEGGIRSWLAEQGIPFLRQHKTLTVIKGA
jgi:hypothetical protein